MICLGEEIEILKMAYQEEIKVNTVKMKEINKKIKDIKYKIDNWNKK